jgi:small subunit ribosomal protein S2
MPRKKKTEEVQEKQEEIKEIKEEKPEEVKKEKTEEKKESETFLIPLEEYIKVSIHIGTRAVTPTMREYVYRRKADGLAVLNTKKVDEKINQASSFLGNYAPGDIIVCGKKDAAVKPLEAFQKATGIRVFTKYPAGIITNSVLKNFFEPKLVMILDPWVDKNALHDATKIKIPVIALCSTNNNTHNVDFVIPCNNKTTNSIGLVLYLLAKLYLEKHGMKENLKNLNKDDFYFIEEKEPKQEIQEKHEFLQYQKPKEFLSKEKIDLTEARELIKKKLAERKAREEAEKK